MSSENSVPSGATPITPQTPVKRRQSNACRATFGNPVHSSENCAPSPVIDVTSFTTSELPPLMVCVAPNSRAKVKRSSFKSIPMIVVQPTVLAAMMAAKPTNPPKLSHVTQC